MIKGHLRPQWADWFDGLSITLQGEAEALLTGPVVDQAALHGLLVIFGVAVQGSGFTLLAMPVAPYEMILAVWLITKGFSSSAIVLESPKTVTNPLPSMA